MEYEAMRKTEIRRRKTKGTETPISSNQSQQLGGKNVVVLHREEGIGKTQVTTRVVGDISHSDQTP
ncbi:hypothetical protein FRX31_024845 [Thalictrum thalictroides]|uniref:Uncharacterized protein n=1 Tax=Thalictrum thalictroides TaxID=46969 RepID=A0A7J6VKB4_THATH|nr:hypothetical protein FRX31_024845 [Thalictrum thalictroides]